MAHAHATFPLLSLIVGELSAEKRFEMKLQFREQIFVPQRLQGLMRQEGSGGDHGVLLLSIAEPNRCEQLQ